MKAQIKIEQLGIDEMVEITNDGSIAKGYISIFTMAKCIETGVKYDVYEEVDSVVWHICEDMPKNKMDKSVHTLWDGFKMEVTIYTLDATYIVDVWTENTGGGVMVDYIRLSNGHVIGINDECAVLYAEMSDGYKQYLENEGSDRPQINFDVFEDQIEKLKNEDN